MSPAVPPTMARVGNQWRPFASCVGNSTQIPFWSSRKSFGKDRQETSRSVVGSLPSLEDRDTCDGLSGKLAPSPCAQAQLGGLQMPAQKMSVSNHRFSFRHIDGF